MHIGIAKHASTNAVPFPMMTRRAATCTAPLLPLHVRLAEEDDWPLNIFDLQISSCMFLSGNSGWLQRQQEMLQLLS